MLSGKAILTPEKREEISRRRGRDLDIDLLVHHAVEMDAALKAEKDLADALASDLEREIAGRGVPNENALGRWKSARGKQ